MNKFDLDARTLDFSKNIICLCRILKPSDMNRIMKNQLLRSATSIGANYREANGSSSKKDFRNKIHICKKEAQETYYWLELLGESNTENKADFQPLLAEAKQLILIFGKITSTLTKELGPISN